jgi:hypothetical protein
MKAKVFKKCLLAGIMSIGLVSTAFADVITLDIQASGLRSNAAATGFLTFDTALLPTIGNTFVQTPLSPAVSNLHLTITGAADGGNGIFGLSDFSSISFSTPSTLDFSKQLIGQVLTNGCTYGTSTGDCDTGNAGDFNLFAAANSTAPNGTYYFQLTAATGEVLLITSLLPEATVPEPTTVVLLSLGLLGVAASRRKSAKSKNA